MRESPALYGHSFDRGGSFLLSKHSKSSQSINYPDDYNPILSMAQILLI